VKENYFSNALPRLQKLLYLKEREEMKDMLITQVKEKYFKEHPEAVDKMRALGTKSKVRRSEF
jgi:hypothetical protein